MAQLLKAGTALGEEHEFESQHPLGYLKPPLKLQLQDLGGL